MHSRGSLCTEIRIAAFGSKIRNTRSCASLLTSPISCRDYFRINISDFTYGMHSRDPYVMCTCELAHGRNSEARTTCSTSSFVSEPKKGRIPVSMTHMITPAAQTSTEPSYLGAQI